MTSKRATVTAAGEGLRLTGQTASGHVLAFDDEAGNTAPRPTETLLAALAACAAMDVLSIMRKKRQAIDSYQVRAEGDQAESHPHVFTDIRLIHEFEGPDIDVGAVRRAIELSATRYCTISNTLASGITRISHWYALRSPGQPGRDVSVLLVTGPGLAPGSMPSEADATRA